MTISPAGEKLAKCQAIDCLMMVNASRSFCEPHWARLPRNARQAVLDEQRHATMSQRRGLTRRWAEVMLECVRFLKEGEIIDNAKPLRLTADKGLLGKAIDYATRRTKKLSDFRVVVHPQAPSHPVTDGETVFVHDEVALRRLFEEHARRQ